MKLKLLPLLLLIAGFAVTPSAGGRPIPLTVSLGEVIHAPTKTLTYLGLGKTVTGGLRSKATFTTNACQVTYPSIGLYASFESIDINPIRHTLLRATPRSCTILGVVVASSVRWETPVGLRVGDQEARIRLLYPHRKLFAATARIPGLPIVATTWILAESRQLGIRPWLVAYVHKERVVALGIQMVGH